MAFIPGIVIFSELNSTGISLKFSQYVNSLNKSPPSPWALRSQTLTDGPNINRRSKSQMGCECYQVSNSRRQGWLLGNLRAEHAAAIGSWEAESGGSQTKSGGRLGCRGRWPGSECSRWGWLGQATAHLRDWTDRAVSGNRAAQKSVWWGKGGMGQEQKGKLIRGEWADSSLGFLSFRLQLLVNAGLIWERQLSKPDVRKPPA